MTDKSILIIGAGVAGLAAGCYAQLNGYHSQILEMHDLPGGLCTGWERQGYFFDGCIHYLYGSAPGAPFNQLWQELGTLEDVKIINHPEFMTVRDQDGHEFTAYCDPDHLETHMLELSPGDERLIKSMAAAVRRFQDFDMSLILEQPRDSMNLLDWAKLGLNMLPFVGTTARFGLLDARGFASKFQDPFLRKALTRVFAWTEIPMIAALSLLAYMNCGNAGFPVGGSLEFARRLERRYLELGGQIHYKQQVEKILVKNDRAVAVRLYSKDEISAAYVISTADGRSTIYDLLDGAYTNRQIDHIYQEGNLPVLSQVLISLGVRRDFSNQPHWVTYLLNQPVQIAGEQRHELGLKHYCFDPSLAPEGCSSLEVMLRSDYTYWQNIYGCKLYDLEQDRVADQVIEQLERVHPGLSSEIEVIDVATPLSYERYTGNWQGSTSGWLLTNKTMPKMVLGMKKTLPGLRNFYMAGQWVEPGGSLTSAAISGRNVINMICQFEARSITKG